MATFFRRSAQAAARSMGRRNFGGHAEVVYEGAEAKLRAILPHDHQVVLAFLGTYAALITLSRMGGSDEAAPAPAAPVATPAATDGAIPSMADAGFDDFIKIPGNAEKYAASFE